MRTVIAALLGGLVAGALDILSAFASFALIAQRFVKA